MVDKYLTQENCVVPEPKMGNEIGNRWTHYVTIEGVDWYYDKSSIVKVSSNIIKLWVKTKYSEKQKNVIINSRKETNQSIDGWEKLDYSLYLYKLDCLNHTYKLMKSVDYNYEGNILDDGRYTDRDEEIIPDTIIDGLRTKVCPKSK